MNRLLCFDNDPSLYLTPLPPALPQPLSDRDTHSVEKNVSVFQPLTSGELRPGTTVLRDIHAVRDTLLTLVTRFTRFSNWPPDLTLLELGASSFDVVRIADAVELQFHRHCSLPQLTHVLLSRNLKEVVNYVWTELGGDEGKGGVGDGEGKGGVGDGEGKGGVGNSEGKGGVGDGEGKGGVGDGEGKGGVDDGEGRGGEVCVSGDEGKAGVGDGEGKGGEVCAGDGEGKEGEVCVRGDEGKGWEVHVKERVGFSQLCKRKRELGEAPTAKRACVSIHSFRRGQAFVNGE